MRYLLIIFALLLVSCSDGGRSTDGSGYNTPGIKYSTEDTRFRPLIGRIQSVVARSKYSREYKALISHIIIMRGTREELRYFAWIQGSVVRLAGDSWAHATTSTMDRILAHEAEHRAEGLLTGWDDPDHLTPDTCIPELPSPNCMFYDAVKKL